MSYYDAPLYDEDLIEFYEEELTLQETYDLYYGDDEFAFEDRECSDWY